MKRLLFCLFCFVHLTVDAQNKIDDVKFSMIKTTIDFYATDTSVFKNSTMTSSMCNTGDYPCLEQFCQVNGLSGVENKINKWKDLDIMSSGSLKAFRDSIIKDLTNGPKFYRTKLPAFELFEKNITDLAFSMDDSAPTEKVGDVQNAQLTANGAIAIPNASNDKFLIWIALLTALMGLSMGIYLFIQKSKSAIAISENSKAEDSGKLELKMKTLSEEFLLLKQNANIALEALVKRVKQNEAWIIQKEAELKKKAASPIGKIKDNSATPSQSSQNIKWYALLPDLDNGFSQKILKDAQDGEQGYELTVSADTGTYEISSNEDAQAFAVNDFNFFLSRGCTLVNQPFPKCRIKNLKPGKLVKTEAGWIIQQKAEIEFM
jgi:hypothetical protein